MHRRQFLAVQKLLWGTESLFINVYRFAIGHLVLLIEQRAGLGLLEGLLVVEGDKAELLLDVSDIFEFKGGEIVRSLE